MNSPRAGQPIKPLATTHGASSFICLLPGVVLTLRQARGTRVEVAAGRIWLTEADDPDDHFLAARESHVLRRSTGVVIQCDSAEPAKLWLLPAS